MYPNPFECEILILFNYIKLRIFGGRLNNCTPIKRKICRMRDRSWSFTFMRRYSPYWVKHGLFSADIIRLSFVGLSGSFHSAFQQTKRWENLIHNENHQSIVEIMRNYFLLPYWIKEFRGKLDYYAQKKRKMSAQDYL